MRQAKISETKLVELYLKKMKIKDLAKYFKVSTDTITVRLKKLGIWKNSLYKIVDSELLHRLYIQEHKTIKSIAKELKLHPSTVVLKLKELNLYDKELCKENISTAAKERTKLVHEQSISASTLKKLYIEEYKTTKDIAKLFKKSNTFIRLLLKEYNLFSKEQSLKNRVLKGKQTNLKKYGTEYVSQVKAFKDKIKETCEKKYGVSNVSKAPEIKDKIKSVQEKKYGTWFLKTKEYLKKSQKTCKKKYGVSNVSQVQKIKDKKIETMDKNKTWGTSKYEEIIYKELSKKFKIVYRQYNKDKRYPFLCDFYIPELDLFIEFNGNFVHGNEPYNPANSEHQRLLQVWKQKAETSRYYKNAIKIWTQRDPLKQQFLKKLNHWSIYNMEQFYEKLKTLNKIK